VVGVLGLGLRSFWVRSYWRSDALIVPYNSTRVFMASSNVAALEIAYSDNQDARDAIQGWTYRTGHAHWDINELGMVGMFNRIKGGLPVIRFPHWALFLLAFAIAVAPWLHGRFGLRTLIIVVTIVAAVCGLLSLYAPMR
jgi:hypothetical protein